MTATDIAMFFRTRVIFARQAINKQCSKQALCDMQLYYYGMACFFFSIAGEPEIHSLIFAYYTKLKRLFNIFGHRALFHFN